MAKEALATHEATLASNQATALHEAQMLKLSSTTANVMTAGGVSSGGSSSGSTSGGGGISPSPDDPLKAEMKALNKVGVP